MWPVAVVCILRDVHRRGLDCVACCGGLYPEGLAQEGTKLCGLWQWFVS